MISVRVMSNPPHYCVIDPLVRDITPEYKLISFSFWFSAYPLPVLDWLYKYD